MSETKSEQPAEDAAVDTNTDPPALNREQRRAQARGKKPAATGNTPFNPNDHRGGAAGRSGGFAGQTKLPRTGHK